MVLLVAALVLLAAAGYELKGTTLRQRGSGRPFRFEIMVTNRDEERLALAFAGKPRINPPSARSRR